MLRRASDGSHVAENADHTTQGEEDDDHAAKNQDGYPLTNCNKKDSNMEILVMQFLKNSIVNNPIIVSIMSTLLLYHLKIDSDGNLLD